LLRAGWVDPGTLFREKPQHQALGMRHRIVRETVLGFAALSTNLQKQSDAAW
jgi:hypothetical protein